MARSNANLAEELKELNFKPELNRKSVGYTKDRNSKLEDRQDGMIQKRNNDLEKQRNFQREQEMKVRRARRARRARLESRTKDALSLVQIEALCYTCAWLTHVCGAGVHFQAGHAGQEKGGEVFVEEREPDGGRGRHDEVGEGEEDEESSEAADR